MNQFKTVITHNGQFHADEVFAVAMLKWAGYHFDLIRTRDKQILEAALKNPEILVLDVGGVFDPEMNNFDHHQDINLPSAAGMIFNELKDSFGNELEQQYLAKFIDAIDAIDVNRDNIYEKWGELPSGFRNVSNIISGFNRNNVSENVCNIWFDRAVEFALLILTNEYVSAMEKAESERNYTNRLILKNNVAVFDEFSNVWKEKNEHQFAILPHKDGWQIQTRDSFVAQVPESVKDCEGFVFRHGTGFMALVKDKQVAIDFALNNL